ncbi:serine hydrolase domain-containing protein [Streptacidiphilus sp. EB129]|uniref:serine hydrolase domain-containing protein n=1 Tax=Streptacidiphilus sp. EB129 TaxID=3156262 RepID=UPI003512935C
MDTESSVDELLPATRRALLHRVAVAQAEGRTPSMVAAVVRDGQRVWTGARSCVEGHAPDADVQFRIGSITKTFVAVLVLRLRDEGLLALTDPIGAHLPQQGLGAAGHATIAQLLSHSAGLTSESPGPWWERTPGELRPALGDVLQQPPTRHPVGQVFHYSNVGFALLGALVERLRGEPWAEVLRREVLEPLGMPRTTPLPQQPHAGGWAVHPYADVLLPEPLQETGQMAPAGQLWSTVADLCRWAAFLADGDDKVLRAESVRELRRPATGVADGEGYGLGLQLLQAHGFSYAGHTGSMPGFLAALWFVPEERLAAVVVANTTSGPIGGIAADLVRITAEHEPRIPEPWRPLPAAEVDPELLALTGYWYWGPSGYLLRLRADRGMELTPVAGSRPGVVPLRPEADGSWTALGGYWNGESLTVVRTGDGAVSHLDLGTFVLTRTPYPVGPADGPVPGGVDPEGWRGL